MKNFVWEVLVQRLDRNLRPQGEPRRITGNHYGDLFGTAWTADGREIVYGAGARHTESLWRVAASGQTPSKRLSYVLPDATFPTISRTPPRLVYTWWRLSLNIWRLNIRTGERRLLIGSAYDSQSSRYSPDGRKIAFQSNRGGSLEVWTCDADGSDCVQLTSFNGPACGAPRWSPDSRWLVLDSRAAGQPDIYVMAADGGAPRRLTDDPADHLLPSWSHDGKWIDFASDRSGRYEIWRMPKDGGPAVQLTDDGAFGHAESADGKYLYYTKPLAGLFRKPIEGGRSTRIAESCQWLYGVTAKGIYFVPDDRRSIRFLDTATGKVKVLETFDGPTAIGLDVSPDETYVLWSQTDRNDIDLMLVEGFR